MEGFGAGGSWGRCVKGVLWGGVLGGCGESGGEVWGEPGMTGESKTLQKASPTWAGRWGRPPALPAPRPRRGYSMASKGRDTV